MADCDPEAFWIHLREQGRLWGDQFNRAQEVPLHLEEYEIVVTGDRIVERRIVLAKSRIFSENRPTSSTYPVSKGAKIYQTLEVFQGYGGFDTRKWLPWKHLAVVALAGMTVWLATR